MFAPRSQRSPRHSGSGLNRSADPRAASAHDPARVTSCSRIVGPKRTVPVTPSMMLWRSSGPESRNDAPPFQCAHSSSRLEYLEVLVFVARQDKRILELEALPRDPGCLAHLLSDHERRMGRLDRAANGGWLYRVDPGRCRVRRLAGPRLAPRATATSATATLETSRFHPGGHVQHTAPSLVSAAVRRARPCTGPIHACRRTRPPTPAAGRAGRRRCPPRCNRS